MSAAALAALTAATLVAAGCSPAGETAPDHLAARTVQEVLEVRARRSTDIADYEPYFRGQDVPQRLVENARAEEGAGITPTPEWETPAVSEERTSSVTVLVVWIPSEDHPGWALTTEFLLEKEGDRWVITDAIEVFADGGEPTLPDEGIE